MSVVGCFLLIVAINLAVGGLATQYVVLHWLHHTLSFFPASLIGLIGGEVIIPACLITWILVFRGVLQ